MDTKPGLPKMHWGDTTRRGVPFAKDPAVVRFGGRYLMYYSLPSYDEGLRPAGAPDGWAIGIAESADRVAWKRIGELLPGGSYEARGLAAPGALVREGRVHLFYQTYGNGPKDALCHAVSSDGVTFLRHPENPIFSPSGAWNNGRAIDADVYPWKDQLLMAYATRDPAGKTQMVGVAAAPLDSGYGRRDWKMLGGGAGPALAPTLPWERECIEAPALIAHADRLYMFYGGAYNNEPQQIGCAVSEDDGVTWTRVSDEPLLPNGLPGAWNESESGHPFAFRDETGGGDFLFFQGNDDGGTTWYLSCAEITWPGGVPALRVPPG